MKATEALMNITELKLKLKKILPKSKSSFLILIGIAGLLLLLVSTFGSKEKASEKNDKSNVSSSKTTTDIYVDELESRLEAILSDMLSNSKVSVMITLDSGIEYVYADEQKTGVEVKNDRLSYKTEQSDSNQNSYVIVKDANGNEKALLVTEIMPKIRGVVIVCESGQTEKVSTAVKTAVKSVLNIDESKICVIGRS